MIDNKFNLKEKVKIKELNVSALVLAIYVFEEGIQYKCRYFDNCAAKTEYFYDFEIEKNESN